MSRTLVEADPVQERRTAGWVAFIACAALVFDGYDLTIYGTVVPTLLNDPSQLGEMTATTAGALGSYAMLGVLFGAIMCGAVGDYLGRRRVILFSITWFSVGMFLTALSTSVMMFGVLRFLTGLGLGALLAVAGATMAEFAPAKKRNLYNAIVYSGIPAGGVLAAGLGILLLEPIGWRGLFIIGAAPILLVPIAWFKLPESPRWLLSRGQRERAITTARRAGTPLVEEATAVSDSASVERTGFAALMTKRWRAATLILGFVSFSGLLLTYGLNTWLPEIMQGYGYDTQGSLMFLLILNGGAVLGALAGSKIADRFSPRPIIVTTFTLAAASLMLMTVQWHISLLLAFIALAGIGTLGTQVLGYGYVSTYYTTNARSAGVAWFAGFGRIGGVIGPFVGGLIAAVGLGGGQAFYLFAGVALFGALMAALVPRQRDLDELEDVLEQASEGSADNQDEQVINDALALAQKYETQKHDGDSNGRSTHAARERTPEQSAAGLPR